jgi:CHRD domain
MNKTLRMHFVLLAAALAAAAVCVTFTVRAHDDDLTAFRARLTGFGEVPPKLVNGQGRFSATLSEDGNMISWTLTWSGLTGPAQVAHIHFGQPQNVGTPVVFFCGGGTKPASCPDGPGHSGTLTGTWTAADVLAVPSQGVTAGDFAGFLKILRAHLGYANIHTAQFSGGEIRGQVNVLEADNDENN